MSEVKVLKDVVSTKTDTNDVEKLRYLVDVLQNDLDDVYILKRILLNRHREHLKTINDLKLHITKLEKKINKLVDKQLKGIELNRHE